MSAPLTELMPKLELHVSAIKYTSRKTPTGEPIQGDARAGARVLGLISFGCCILGIAAEMFSILLAVSASQQAAKLDWPIAHGTWTWNHCEFLPNSDAPATSYGAGAGLFFHALNMIVFMGLGVFFVRFGVRPLATYGCSTAGLFLFWLGLGLASRWLGNFQVMAGGLLIIAGIMDFLFGLDKFFEATMSSYTGKELKKGTGEKAKPGEQADEEPDAVPDNSALRKFDAMRFQKQQQAYFVANPYSGGQFSTNFGGIGGGGGMGGMGGFGGMF